ncbi:MAG TPA: DUF1462 family protein [Chloroflexota bacterium]|nr:DUF1462 family protein [Chloroflexota bacterium]
MTQVVAWYLSREYGNSVQVHYNDLSQAEVRQRFPSVVEKLKKGEVILPAVYVDDEIVNLGYVDYFKIAKAIEQSRGKSQASS